MKGFGSARGSSSPPGKLGREKSRERGEAAAAATASRLGIARERRLCKGGDSSACLGAVTRRQVYMRRSHRRFCVNLCMCVCGYIYMYVTRIMRQRNAVVVGGGERLGDYAEGCEGFGVRERDWITVRVLVSVLCLWVWNGSKVCVCVVGCLISLIENGTCVCFFLFNDCIINYHFRLICIYEGRFFYFIS